MLASRTFLFGKKVTREVPQGYCAAKPMRFDGVRLHLIGKREDCLTRTGLISFRRASR